MSNNRVSKYEIQRCNDWLAEKYGKDTLGNPRWRIVWSEDQKEKRLGTFTDFDNSTNFIKTVKEVREVPKYPFNKECYILECQAFVEGDEIKNHNGYDIIYPFQDKDNKRVDPNLEAIMFMFEVMLFQTRQVKTDPVTAAQNEEKAFNRDVENIERGLEP